MSDLQRIQYRGKFLQRNASKDITVINDNKIVLKTAAYKSAKMDTPIDIGQNVIYCWQMMMDHAASHKNTLDSCDMFGVVSNKCNNIGAAPWGGLIDSYGIAGAAPYVWHGTQHDYKKDNTFKTTIKKNEIVTIELNCKTSQLTFKLKNKIIYGPLNLPKRKSWYPAVSLTHSLNNYNWSATFIPPKIENDIEETKQKETIQDLNEQISKLKDENMKLIESQSQINDQVIQYAEKNSSLQDENKALQNKNEQLNKIETEYNSLMERYKKIEKENIRLKKENSDLNEECKQCKLELNDIKSKYNKLYRKHNIDINNYKNWNYETITDWIISLDEAFEIYESSLRSKLKDESLDGSDLQDISTTDLDRFGVKAFKHKKFIMNHIKKLTQPQENKSNLKAYNEGNNDTAYIG